MLFVFVMGCDRYLLSILLYAPATRVYHTCMIVDALKNIPLDPMSRMAELAVEVE